MKMLIFTVMLITGCLHPGTYAQKSSEFYLKGRIVASDRFAALYDTSASRHVRTYIVEQTSRSNEKITTSYIILNYHFWKSDGEFVDKLYESNKLWKFHLVRTCECDANWRDIKYTTIIQNNMEQKSRRFEFLGDTQNISEDAALQCFDLMPKGTKQLNN